METIIPIFDVLGYFSTGIVIVSLLIGVWTWIRGILPAMIRLGRGLAKRKIAIFAKGNNLTSIKSLLMDSTLFNKRNMIEIASINDLGRAEAATLFMVYWHDWLDDIDKLLGRKADSTALVVYAPRELGLISEDHMRKIAEQRNTTVTNFRGRLLNDIVTSMITTSYD
jgi:hypothetical protein